VGDENYCYLLTTLLDELKEIIGEYDSLLNTPILDNSKTKSKIIGIKRYQGEEQRYQLFSLIVDPKLDIIEHVDNEEEIKKKKLR
ncbi:MAG: hypothetical protein MJ252_14840, partial [archaeon]|nr:hypothetical protein [archaeon]